MSGRAAVRIRKIFLLRDRKVLGSEFGIFAVARREARGASFKNCSELFCGGEAVRNVGRSSSTAFVLFRWGPPRFGVFNFALAGRDFLREAAQRKGALNANGSRNGVTENFRDPFAVSAEHCDRMVALAKCGLGELR